MLKNLQAGSRWYDISVEVGPPAALNRRPAVVRIDGVEAPDQTIDESGDAARTFLAVDIGRIYPSNCGLASLRFDDVLVVRRQPRERRPTRDLRVGPNARAARTSEDSLSKMTSSHDAPTMLDDVRVTLRDEAKVQVAAAPIEDGKRYEQGALLGEG